MLLGGHSYRLGCLSIEFIFRSFTTLSSLLKCSPVISFLLLLVLMSSLWSSAWLYNISISFF